MVGLVLILAAAATAALAALSLRPRASSATLVAAYVGWVADLALVDPGAEPAASGRPGRPRRRRRASCWRGLRSGGGARAVLGRSSGLSPIDPVTARRARGGRRAARVRARARADRAAGQLGRGLLPPDARRRLASSRRRLLGAERAHRPDQRVPAPRRAAAALPLRCDRQRPAVRAAAVPGRGGPARLRLRLGAAARLRRAARRRARRASSPRSGSLRTRRRRPRTTWWRRRSSSAAAFLLLGSRAREDVLAGVAAGLGLGIKLTTILAWPVLIGLALLRGGRTLGRAGLGAAGAFLAVGCWGFVLNLAQTGHVLGHGGGRVGDTTTPSYPASLVTLLSILYTTLDLSVLWPRLIAALAVVGGIVAAVLLVRRRRRTGAGGGGPVSRAVPRDPRRRGGRRGHPVAR